MAETLTTYDPAEDLTSDEAIASFMAEAFQTNDAGYIAHALGVVARAKGMTQIAAQTGLPQFDWCVGRGQVPIGRRDEIFIGLAPA